MSPIRAQKARALMGLEYVGTAVCGGGGCSGFARGHFLCALAVRRFSFAGATVVTLDTLRSRFPTDCKPQFEVCRLPFAVCLFVCLSNGPAKKQAEKQ